MGSRLEGCGTHAVHDAMLKPMPGNKSAPSLAE